MSLAIPEWLDEELLLMCIEGGKENRTITIKTFDVSEVVPFGNNYGSFIRRVNVKFVKRNTEGIHKLSLIVKAPVIDGAIKDMFSSTSATSESIFYKKYIPISTKISLSNHFVAKPYFSNNPNIIFLEDLKTQGFVMADRYMLLDFNHCHMYAIAAATFHAVSVAVHKKEPELVESLGQEKFFSNDTLFKPFKQFVLSGIWYMREQMEHMDDYKIFASLLRNPTVIWDLLVEIHKPRESLNALHQGDPWTTNMMFKYDTSGKVEDIRLLDFQVLRYSSPVNDLVFFIWTTADHYVRENRLEEIYRVYCETLNRKLEELNCSERLSYEELMENIRILSPAALALSASFYPIMISPTPVDVNLLLPKDCDEVKTKNAFRPCYNEEFCKSELPRVLKQLESRGVFDYLEKHIQGLDHV